MISLSAYIVNTRVLVIEKPQLNQFKDKIDIIVLAEKLCINRNSFLEKIKKTRLLIILELSLSLNY